MYASIPFEGAYFIGAFRSLRSSIGMIGGVGFSSFLSEELCDEPHIGNANAEIIKAAINFVSFIKLLVFDSAKL